MSNDDPVLTAVQRFMDAVSTRLDKHATETRSTLAEIQTRVLRESGEWVRAHADAIHGSSMFDVPGNAAHWYTRRKRGIDVQF